MAAHNRTNEGNWKMIIYRIFQKYHLLEIKCCQVIHTLSITNDKKYKLLRQTLLLQVMLDGVLRVAHMAEKQMPSGGHSKLALNMEIKQHYHNQECWLTPPHNESTQHILVPARNALSLLFSSGHSACDEKCCKQQFDTSDNYRT